MLALLLIVIGLFSSVFHLANKKNGWRAFIPIRSSWLSREAVFAVLFFVPAVLYLAGVFLEGAHGAAWVSVSGIVAALLAVVTCSRPA